MLWPSGPTGAAGCTVSCCGKGLPAVFPVLEFLVLRFSPDDVNEDVCAILLEPIGLVMMGLLGAMEQKKGRAEKGEARPALRRSGGNRRAARQIFASRALA